MSNILVHRIGNKTIVPLINKYSLFVRCFENFELIEDHEHIRI